uniref:Plasmid maintenance system killer n=1 Tax=Solibacter usitatus (strain Ellin6076) TaxID=234267 RepID=Q02B77_SOLUE
MIGLFKCSDTVLLFDDQRVRRFQSIERPARRKLLYLHRALRLEDLRVSPGNQLELLKGGRAGTYSMRINDRWRICFAWREGDAYDVEVVDYH